MIKVSLISLKKVSTEKVKTGILPLTTPFYFSFFLTCFQTVLVITH